VEHSVAAVGGDATVEACVVVALIGVIAFFDAGVHEAVTASRRHASGEAIVGIVGVSVVALLAGLLDPVATRGEGAVIAALVCIVGVAVIAGLEACTYDAVATVRSEAAI
jgi:hypothetical protein